MKRWLASAALALALAVPAGAEATDPALWFPVGEELLYEVHWGFLRVGETHVTTCWTNHNGRRVIAIRYVTKTNGLVAHIYPVEDTLESLIDPATFLPLRFWKKTREGRHRGDEVTDFDHARGEATWTNRLRVPPRVKVLPIDADTRDIIAMMYWLRREPFAVGGRSDYRVMADDKVYDLGLKVSAEETVTVGRYGPVPCHRIDPEAAFNGLFVRKGRLVFWVSQDDRRICTRMLGEVPVASIRVELVEVRGPGRDFWVKPAAGAGPKGAIR